MRRRARFLSIVATGVAALSGCTVGPRYKRPDVAVPQTYRGGELSNTDNKVTEPNVASLANEKWWEVFADPELQNLIRQALQENYDVRIAAQRVLEAQAQVGITRAQQLPTVEAGKFPD